MKAEKEVCLDEELSMKSESEAQLRHWGDRLRLEVSAAREWTDETDMWLLG